MKRIALLVIALPTGLFGCQSAATSPAERPPAEAQAAPSHEELTRVVAEHVCMVNDTHFGKAQIPVQVGGLTYYGCCEMCQERLTADPAIRKAKDPVTGREVDKASAIIGARADGSVLYFESAATLRQYTGG